MEQPGRDTAVDPGEPGGGIEWGDWLWENYTGLSHYCSVDIQCTVHVCVG